MTAPRPGCATSIRTAAATVTEQVLLRVPPEPCVGSEVEVRIPPRLHIDGRGRKRNDGGHTDRFVSVDDPRSSASARRERRWAPAASPDAHAIDRLSWRSLCSAAMRHSGGRVVLVREGPLNTDTEGGRVKVTITVENDDQDVEISRSRADVISPRGRVDEPSALAGVLDLAVADTRRALALPSAPGRCGKTLPHLGGAPETHCALDAGHDGWHRDDNGTEAGTSW